MKKFTLLAIMALAIIACKKPKTEETKNTVNMPITYDPALIGTWKNDSSQNPAGTGYVADGTDTSTIMQKVIFNTEKKILKTWIYGNLSSTITLDYKVIGDSIKQGSSKYCDYYYKLQNGVLLLQLQPGQVASDKINYWYHKQ